METITLFQSSPDPKAGRYFGEVWPSTHGEMFQSSPDPKAGRYLVDKYK